ncbi:MAG: gliding motility-associated C-terminal domain-containing protein [Bacteroidales bacterium]|nr:gliding motility-associated C-terminal domain-containing protein [Bacteroidales bacterium]
MIKYILLCCFWCIIFYNILKGQNDNCTGALPLSVTANCNNPVSGTTAGATQSLSGCVGTADDDVWYRFTATASSHVITVTPSSNFDAVVELFSGSCSNLTSLYCRDFGLSGESETIYATGLTSGNTYYIRVYHYHSGSGSNTFTICVSNYPSAPSNDNCSNASTLVVSSTCSYTNSTSYGATSSGVVACAGSPDDDVWFKFTATNSVQTISVVPSANMDPVVELFSGTCTSLTSLYCQDQGFTNGNETINAIGLIPGQTYYIRVYDYYNSNGGYPFQICVYGPTSATPVNDECTSAIELPEVTSECQYYYFTTNNASTSSQPAPSNCENFDGSPNNGGFQSGTKDVWFKIKVPQSGKLSIRPKPSYGINDAAMALYSGTCSSLTQIACSDDHNYPGTSNDMKPYIKATGLTPGTYVYLRYWAFGTASGNFAICVESPTNDNCSSSLYICDINGYSGSTSEAYTIDRPCNMRGNAETYPDYTYTPGTCQGGIFGAGGPWGQGAPNCDVRIDNNSWIKFTASNTSVTLNVTISNCWVGNYPSGGIQMQIFSGSNCCNFQPVSDFKEGSSSFSITANNLTIGQDYYLMIDGFAGDICDYSITANTGVQFTEIQASSTTICAGQSVTLTAPSGATSYLWMPGGQTTQSIVVSPATTMTYTCEVTGVCNYKQTLYKTIIVNPLPQVSASNNSPICQGGTLNLSATGGVSYSWSGPSGFSSSVQNPTITNVSTLHAGVYTVTVTSNQGCTSTGTTTVIVNTAPSSPTVTATPSSICLGQSSTINATANGASYYQVYTQPSGGTLLGTTPLTVSPTSTTTYYVQAVSNNGCVNLGGRVPVTVTVNPLPNASATSNSGICSGQTLQLNASGGSSYQWSGPNNFSSTQQNPSIPNAQSIHSGTYYVTVTNSYGCTATASTNVVINSLPNITINSNSPICSGQSLNLYSSGGTSYQWSGPNGFSSNQQNPIIPNASTAHTGVYYVTVSNGNCSTSSSINVIVNQTPTASASSNSPLCTGQTLTLNASGGTSYQWSGPNGFSSQLQNPSISNAQSMHQGTYYVTVTGANGCTATASVTVYINNSFNTTINPAGPFCTNSGQQTLTAATPGGTWSGQGIVNSSTGTFDPSIAGPGTHVITYTISGNCGSSSSTTITVYSAPTAMAQSNSPICEGQQLQLSANTIAGATYLWNGPNNFTSIQQNPILNNANINNSGPYYLTITDANGCTGTSIVNVIINPAPVVSITANNPVCVGSTLNLNASSGYSSYNWQGPNNFSGNTANVSIPNITPNAQGNYYVTVTNSIGCTATSSIYINVLTFTAGTISVNTSLPSCSYSNDGIIQVLVSGGTPPYNYSWSHNQNLNSAIANNLQGGYYSVTITDGNGCKIDTIINLPAPSPILINLNYQNPKCFGSNDGFIHALVSGGTPNYSYLWNNNSNTSQLVNIGPGLYQLTVTDNNNCTAISEIITISEPDEIIISIQGTSQNCPSEIMSSASVTISGGIPPYSYLWNTGQTTQLISNLQTGIYSVTVTDANYCTKTASIEIISPNNFSNLYQIIKDTINCLATIDNNLSGGTPPYTFQWSNGNNTEDLVNVEAGTYILTVTDANNCTYIDTFKIELPILIPNFITPNNDNKNDKFAIRNVHTISELTIQIFDRWGNLIFKYNGTGPNYANSNNQWDGTYNGKKLPTSSYIYIVTVNNKDTHKGIVSIIY